MKWMVICLCLYSCGGPSVEIVAAYRTRPECEAQAEYKRQIKPVAWKWTDYRCIEIGIKP